ncbi:MAG: hypothetical protein H7Y07_11920 [Pyrinomonadaceae bacterium]|nr:hypothetical protein [Sphingobacteriaceae bacterium]
MNQTFNLNRFSKLFIKHTADNFKTYSMAFSVLIGFLILSMGFVAYMSGGKLEVNFQIPFFMFILLQAGSIFTSIAFADLGNKKKAISSLTLPASHFEKYLIAWTYSYLIFQLLYVPAFYLVVMLINQISTLNPNQPDPKLLDLFDKDQGVYIVFLIYAVLHSIALLGSIYFEKLQFIKTAFSFFVAIFIITLANLQFLKAFISKEVHAGWLFGSVGIRTENDSYKLNILERNADHMVIMVVIIVIILWTCTFYRLKEKEV